MKIRVIIVFLIAWVVSLASAYNPTTFSEHSNAQHRFFLDEKDDDTGQLFITYVDAGPREGKAILLVHGVPTSSWSYRRMAANLSSLGYRVIVPDLLGFGNSAKPDDTDYYDLDKQGSRLLELMDHLEIDSWIQVLHDVGGLVTWEMMGTASERITGLVILNTFAYEEGWHPPKSLDNPVVKFSMGLIGFKSKAIIRATICDMLALPDELDNDVSLGGYYEPLQNGADKAYLAFMTSFDVVRERLPHYRKILRANPKPSIVIWGGHDETLNGQESIPLFREDLKIPSYNIFFRGDAKHLVMEEIPGFIVDRIIVFSPPL